MTFTNESYEPIERRLKMSDGATIFYRAWLPPTPAKVALLLFHRGHEHSGRWQETVEDLQLNEVAVFAWDARGHCRRRHFLFSNAASTRRRAAAT